MINPAAEVLIPTGRKKHSWPPRNIRFFEAVATPRIEAAGFSVDRINEVPLWLSLWSEGEEKITRGDVKSSGLQPGTNRSDAEFMQKRW